MDKELKKSIDKIKDSVAKDKATRDAFDKASKEISKTINNKLKK